MAKAARKKPRTKRPKLSDQKQSERFIEAARKLGIEEAGDQFEKAIGKLLPRKNDR